MKDKKEFLFENEMNKFLIKFSKGDNKKYELILKENKHKDNKKAP